MTTTLFALFDTSGRSDEAVKAITAAGLEVMELQVIENLPAANETGRSLIATPVPSNLPTAGMAAALTGAQDELFAGSNLSDSQKAFLSRGVGQGGQIVMVQLPQASAGDAARILKERGGRVLPD